ncbi:putative ribonuclease H-like domain-containing protein, partial [Tanacetum coccineum]
MDNEDLEQIDADDLKEMGLKWQVSMLTMRVKRNRDDPRRNAPVDTSTTNALVVQDGIGSSSSSSSDSEVHTCSKDCYQIGLESLEARIVVHEKNEAAYEENIKILKYDVQLKDISIKDLKNQLEEALKEKDDLKLKLENFEESSNILTKLINSQISAKDKTGHGYDDQMNESELNNIHMNMSEVVHSVFNSRESNVDDNPVNDRFKIEKPKTVRPSAPIIEEWDTDNDNDSLFRPNSNQTKPKFTKINFVKSGENVKFVNKKNTHRQVEYTRKSQSPRGNKRNWNGMMTQKLRNGFEFIKKACFGKVTGQREIKPVWNNAQRVNHQNKLTHPHPKRNFIPTTVATKSGQVPVNAAKQSSPRAATSISTARPVNTAAPKPKVKDALPTTYSYFKAHSPGNPQYTLQDQGIFDSGCSRHMTGNKSFLIDYQEIDGGFVAFGGSPKGDETVFKEWDDRVVRATTTAASLDAAHASGIKREFSVARTPQQNGVAERKNMTLIEAARTMLADSLLPTTFWAKAVNTACYVQNRVLVTNPHNKTPYELLHSRSPSISFIRPFGCLVTILNTLDPLGKFDGKADDGFLVGYSINSKAFKVFTTRTRKVEESMHITFLENKPNVARSGPDWLFDFDLLINSMNYEPVTAENQTNRNAGIKDNVDAGERNGQEKEGGALNKEGDQNVQNFRAELDNLLVQQKEGYATSTNRVSTVSSSVSAAGQSFDNIDDLLTDPLMHDLEDTANLLNTGILSGAYNDEDEGTEADLNNLETTMNVSPIPTTRIHKDNPKDKIIGDINSATQTRRMTKISEEQPKKVIQALDDPSWIEAMQEELLQIEAIRLFFAYASFMGFIVYQMYVKSVDFQNQVFALVARIEAI